MIREKIETLRKIRNARKNKYVSNFSAVKSWLENSKAPYSIHSFQETIQKYKKSETIFILGSGPSLNKLTSKEIDIINQHDSLGINFSFLKKEIVPTYHQFSWERDYSYNFLKNAFEKQKEKYQNTVIFLCDKAIHRFAHPRITPELFPVNPVCCRFDLPESLVIEEGDFSESMLEHTLFYRGTLSMQLQVLREMGYKNFVLIGIDLDTNKHFFDDDPVMKEYTDILYSKTSLPDSSNKKEKKKKFESMYTKKGKSLPFDQYLEAVANFLNKKEMRLFTAFENDYMGSRLPAYFKR
jgi:hypothetical protein